MTSPAESKSDFRPPDKRLLAAFVIGPVAALTAQLIGYTLAPTACERGSKLLLHATMAAFFVIALCGALLGRARAEEERVHWMSIVATTISLASALVIVAMEIPNLMLGSCD